ncbi:MAG: hypothetical protein ACJAUQ_000454 [Maribacter sp.]|jgi:hypothetical protein
MKVPEMDNPKKNKPNKVPTYFISAIRIKA